MIKIAPSILSADFTNLKNEIQAAEKAGADIIHIDVMDGHFVPNISIGPMIVEAARRCTELPLDVHLMITDPDQYISHFVEAGADWISVHVEVCIHLQRTLKMIRDHGIRCGAVLNPATPLSFLDHVLEDMDFVLLMSVNPGFGGQQFIPATLKKIRTLKKIISDANTDVEIEIDGGIKPENAKDAILAGAEVLVAGSSVFKSSDYTEAIKAIRGEANPLTKMLYPKGTIY